MKSAKACLRSSWQSALRCRSHDADSRQGREASVRCSRSPLAPGVSASCLASVAPLPSRSARTPLRAVPASALPRP